MNQQERPAGQIIPLSKPPQYWLRRAEQHRRHGEHRRAAALLRHAVALDPASGDLRMEYAKSLRDISCYEASTREAFTALTLEPADFAPYQIIGRNLLSMGREQEAVDAFAHYMEKAQALPEMLFSLSDEDEFSILENFWEERPRRGRARLDSLCHIAAQRLARGALPRAEAAILRVATLSPADKRLPSLRAMLFEARGQLEEALVYARLSLAENPRHIPSFCALATVRFRMGQRGLAAATLMRAAYFCRFPHDEQLFCFTAAAVGVPALSLAMLQLARHRSPGRMPTLFNCAVVLLQMGKQKAAMGYLHHCLELDPEDMAVQGLFRTAQRWAEEGLPQAEAWQEARALSFYPFLPVESLQLLLADLGHTLEQGMEIFARRLLEDKGFYRGYLHALFLPNASLPRLVYHVAVAMAAFDAGAAERMLRDILVQNAPGESAKRYALAALVFLEAKPPYVIWQSGRILRVFPPGGRGGIGPALRHRLVQRIREVAGYAKDARLIPHALALLSRMSHRRCYAVAADYGHIWSAALWQHFALSHGLGAPALPWERIAGSPGLTSRMERAFMELCAVKPLPFKEE